MYQAGRHPSPRHGIIRGFQTSKQLYFTIDCNWVLGSQKVLEALLDCCDRYRMEATVFFTGCFAKAYPELVWDCHLCGHLLGTHGWAHGGFYVNDAATT